MYRLRTAYHSYETIKAIPVLLRTPSTAKWNTCIVHVENVNVVKPKWTKLPDPQKFV